MLPATLAGSFAFVSPIATPANAISYSMGHLSMHDLASVGSVLTVLCVGVLLVLFPPLFEGLMEGNKVPVWAEGAC
jgi:sodium-dependent dicarboxylate transporter 2/3/5